MKQPMTVYAADCVNNPTNCHYPREIVIADVEIAKEALSKDIVCAKYKNDYRSIKNFMWTNTLPNTSEKEYTERHSALCRKFEETESAMKDSVAQREHMIENKIAIGGMLFELQELDTLPIEFDESLWNAIIEKVTVYIDKRIEFLFKDGKEVSLTR